MAMETTNYLSSNNYGIDPSPAKALDEDCSNDGADVENGMEGDFVDITSSFMSACNTLDVGQLAHGPHFVLQDAMSAIEIMDPKMDARMQMKRRVVYLQEALNTGQLPLANIDMAELLGVMDETLAAWVNWLEGDTLAQTVFTNMFMHCTLRIEDRSLRAFCEGVKKCISIVRNIIIKAGVYEEEDFFSSVHGMPLETADLTEQRVTGMLKEVDEDLSRNLRSGTSNTELTTAIQYRLRFVRSLLLWGILVNKFLDHDRQLNLPAVRQECQRYIDSLTKVCILMRDTAGLGKMATGKDNPREEPYGLVGFEPFLNQPRLPPTIPRYARIMDRAVAMNYYVNLIGRLLHVTTILDEDMAPDVHTVWPFIERYGRYGHNGQSCVLSRSLLILLYTTLLNGKSKSRSNFKVDIFKSSMKHFVNLPSWPTVEQVLAANSNLDRFVEVCANHLFQIPVIYCHNRARQRMRLEQIVDATWELFDECHRADIILHEQAKAISVKTSLPSVFSAYVIYFHFKLMWDYLMIGFELELYSTHELPYIYSVLGEILLPYFASHLRDLEQHQRLYRESHKARKGKKKEEDNNGHLQWLTNQIFALRAHESLACGTLLSLAAFLQDSKWALEELPFGSEEVRYQQRLWPLLNRGRLGDCASYSRFQHKWLEFTTKPLDEVYANAVKYFDGARTIIDQCSPEFLLDKENLAKIAKNNLVMCRLFSSGNKRGIATPVTMNFDVSLSKAYPLFKLA